MRRFNMLIVITLPIVISSTLAQKQKQQNDDLCPRITTVLCMKDVLADISSAAKQINDVAYQIERDIREYDPNIDNYKELINEKVEHLRSSLLKSDSHYQFMNVNNNINKTDIINIMKEENHAFSYIYNSIKSILKMQNVFNSKIDKSFTKILNLIPKHILCNYRDILHLYGETWLSIDEINGIHISRTRKRSAPSVLHQIYSFIVTRLIHEWMEHINHVDVNIGSKILR